VGARFQNWWNKNVWDASKSSTGPTFDLKGTDYLNKIFGFNDNFANEPVTEHRALGLSTVFTCLNVRSRTIASLPINPMIEEGKEKRVITDHPIYEPLSQKANGYMSSAQMFLTSMIHSDAWGNSVIGINRDSRQRPYAFDVIEPGEWDVRKSDGEAWYKINGEIYPSRDVLHFRWFSLDGLVGISPIRQNQILMGGAFKQAKYQTYALGQRPPGILSYEGNLDPTQREQNQKSWAKDMDNGKVPILSGKWHFEPIILPPGEAEYVSQAGLTAQQICGLYQMPPAFVQNYERMTWNNAEQVDLLYAKHTITPICRIIEQELNMKLFTTKEQKNHFTKFNLNGLLRADTKARSEFYSVMRNVGGLDGNEIRSLEDMNGYEGGDIKTVQGALVPVDMLRKHYENLSANAEQQPAPAPKKGEKVNGFTHEYN
jgi:HK97 family phage portal protein